MKQPKDMTRDELQAEVKRLRKRQAGSVAAPTCQHGYTHGHSATCGGSSAGPCEHGYTHGHSATCPGGQGGYGPTSNYY